jgi:hypothetical protein
LPSFIFNEEIVVASTQLSRGFLDRWRGGENETIVT